MVSRELLDEFKMIYMEEFNTAITDEEATEMSTELINLMRVLIQPDPIDPDSNPESNNNQIEKGEPSEIRRILNK